MLHAGSPSHTPVLEGLHHLARSSFLGRRTFNVYRKECKIQSSQPSRAPGTVGGRNSMHVDEGRNRSMWEI